MKAEVFAVIGRRKQDKCVYYAIRAGASYVCRSKSRAVARTLREGPQARARGTELGRIAFPSSAAASFSARTDAAAAERAKRKSAARIKKKVCAALISLCLGAMCFGISVGAAPSFFRIAGAVFFAVSAAVLLFLPSDVFLYFESRDICAEAEKWAQEAEDGIFLFLKRKAADNGNADKDPDIYGIERTYGALVGIFGEDGFFAKIKTGGILRGREVDAAAKESYRMLFGTDTQTAPSFEEWKSAVSEYADVPWAELADRAEKAAMLPKAEEVRSNR